MIYYTLCFLLGIVSLNLITVLPSFYWVLVFLLLVIFSWRYSKFFSIYFLGVAWIILYSHWLNSWELPINLESKNISLQGVIASIPEMADHGIHFIFAATKFNDEKIRTKIRLSWHATTIRPHVGEEWQFIVRLKRIHGNQNPGGYDYEAYAFQEGIRAQGYIVTQFPQLKLAKHWYSYPINQLREILLAKILSVLSVSITSHWIPALCLGIRNQIPVADWEVLRATGTNHLMAIGGLHIGMMAGLAHFVFRRLWSLSVRCLQWIPATIIAAVGSLFMTLIYSALSGFSIPAQRASLMLIFFLILIVKGRHQSPWQAWSLALITVLLINPLTTLTESFWLSFAAVAFIIYGMSYRVAPTGLWWKYGRVQWVIAIGLIPFTLFFFNQLSLISFVANMIAIPWVAIGVVPLCVVGTLCLFVSSKIGGLFLFFADKILSLLWVVLTWLAHCPRVVWHQSISHWWMFLIAVIAVIFLLVPRSFPGRYFGIFWLIPIIFDNPSTPAKNEFWLNVLDVGQGLAIVVQTQNHNLVFDTGARLGASLDMGASVVVPFLQYNNIKKLDMVIISHGDNDHIGGFKALSQALPILTIKTSVPEKILHSELCLRGDKWNWDGVNFEFLYPVQSKLHLNNDSSCVLRISNGDKNVLLTGDIEKVAENEILANIKEKLFADVLVAPHHGSKTSGVNAFIESVSPKYVIFANGYRNRYHFPHSSVVKKYQKINANMLATADVGAVQFKLSANNFNLDLYRVSHRQYWNAK